MAASAFDPFQVLGISPGATREQIRAAYRELVARYHPDKHRGNPLEELAAAKLVEINRAYEILSDDGRRAAYEVERSVGAAPRARASATPAVVSPEPVMKVLHGVGLVLTLLFLLRFGLALGVRLIAVFRGILVGVFSLARSPVGAIAILVVLAIFTSFVVRSRKHRG